MRDVLLDSTQPLKPALDIGVGVSKHLGTTFGSRQEFIGVVSAHHCGSCRNVVHARFQTGPFRFRLLQDQVNGIGDQLNRGTIGASVPFLFSSLKSSAGA